MLSRDYDPVLSVRHGTACGANLTMAVPLSRNVCVGQLNADLDFSTANIRPGGVKLGSDFEQKGRNVSVYSFISDIFPLSKWDI